MDQKKLLSAGLLILTLVFVLSVQKPIEEEELLPAVGFATDHEFLTEPAGMALLEELYDLRFDAVHDMVMGLTHEALRAGDVDVAMGFAADGMIQELQLVRLDDDRGAFPVCYVTPVIRQEVLHQYPDLATLLAALVARLDTSTMMSLNHSVTIEEQDPYEVARGWLKQEGLITATIPALPGDQAIRVGSHETTDHRILGNLVLAALQAWGIPGDDHTQPPVFGSNRDRIVDGTIDLYWECHRPPWFADVHEVQAMSDDKVMEAIATMDAKQGIIWLDPAPFVHSRALLMRKEHATELGISTISELAAWVQEIQTSRP